MNREQHLKWAKQRALAELDADRHGRGPVNALNSMMSDLGKHPDTASHPAIMVTGMLMFSGQLTGADEVQRHIDGFQ